MAQRDISGKGLVDRRAARTRAEILEAAIDLFVAQGFEATSMEQVAEAAGVSRRTLYRYFATKDDIAFDLPREWLAVLEAALATRRDDEPTRDLWRRAIRDVAVHVRDDAPRVLRAFSVVASSPELAARHGRSDAEWVQRYVGLMAPDVAGLEHGELQAVTAAMALVAAQNALIAVWAAQQPDADLLEMTRRVVEQMDPVWPAPCRRPPR
jgi:AcrR family transcriptional regulator